MNAIPVKLFVATGEGFTQEISTISANGFTVFSYEPTEGDRQGFYLVQADEHRVFYALQATVWDAPEHEDREIIGWVFKAANGAEIVLHND